MPAGTKNEVLNVGKLLNIYSNNGKYMNKVGQTLTSKMSRKIYGILIEKELTANDIAKIVSNGGSPRLPNVVSILDKMEEVGLVTRTKKLRKINRYKEPEHPLNFYKAIPFILIIPPFYVKKISKNRKLQDAFQEFFSTF